MPITVSEKIKLNKAEPVLDSRYGPYGSVEEAYEALGSEGADVLCIGLTVGIQKEEGQPIVEYWFQNGIGLSDLVQKDTQVDVDGEFSESSENPVKNSILTQRFAGIDETIQGLEDSKQDALSFAASSDIADLFGI